MDEKTLKCKIADIFIKYSINSIGYSEFRDKLVVLGNTCTIFDSTEYNELMIIALKEELLSEFEELKTDIDDDTALFLHKKFIKQMNELMIFIYKQIEKDASMEVSLKTLGYYIFEKYIEAKNKLNLAIDDVIICGIREHKGKLTRMEQKSDRPYGKIFHFDNGSWLNDKIIDSINTIPFQAVSQ